MASIDNVSRTAPVSLQNFEIPTIRLNNGMELRRIINGLWQTASPSWGVDVSSSETIGALANLALAGYSSFDGADIYGPAEVLMGKLKQSVAERPLQLLTKYVPNPTPQSRQIVEAAIRKSRSRMSLSPGEALDMVQFHWWDYSQELAMLQAIDHLDALRKEGLIAGVGLTNFDTIRVRQFVDRGIPITSNQVQFSVIDSRPLSAMSPYCADHGIHLLTYGTLMGGFLSDEYLGKPEPNPRGPTMTPSKGKYLKMIRQWGSWTLFQEMLHALRQIADRHQIAISSRVSSSGDAEASAESCSNPINISIANIGTRWVLEQPAVGAVIVGVRPGVSDHSRDNAIVFQFALTPEDKAEIAAIQAKGRDLMQVIGDCGDEYR